MFITAHKRSCGKVLFLHLSVSHSVHRGGGGGSLYGVTSCLATWSHVPSRGFLSGGLSDRDPPGQRSPLYGKERAVRILIECILVLIFI